MMSAIKLGGLAVLVVLISALLGEYTMRVLGALFVVLVEDYIGGMGDGPLIFYGLLLGFVVRPVIAGACGAVILPLIWRAINRADQASKELGIEPVVSVVLMTAVVSIFWAGLETFWLNGPWP